MKLYEIADSYRKLAEALESGPSEITPEMEAAIAAMEGDLETKCRNVVGLVRELETESEAIAKESSRLAQLADSKANAAKRLRDYLKRCLENAGVWKLDVGIAKIGIQKASRPSIVWDYLNFGQVPEEFRRIKIELDGAKAFEAWKANALPAGFDVKFSNFLTIR